MKNDIITLKKVTQVKDTDGYTVSQTETETTVFAEKKSVARSEFYDAMRAGLSVSAIFVVNVDEYNDATEVEYNDKTYKVERTYQVDENDIELTCSDMKV